MPKGSVAISLAVLLSISILLGGSYLYYNARKTSSEADALLMAVRNNLSPREVERLTGVSENKISRFVATFESVSGGYLSAVNIASSLDPISQLDQVAKQEVVADLQTKKDAVADVLEKWKVLEASLPDLATRASQDNLSAIIEISKEYIAVIKDYIDALGDAASDLTPENSGLTQEEIDAYKEAIDDASGSVDQISDDLDDTHETVNTDDVSSQQNPSGDTSSSVDQTTQSDGTGTTGGSSDTQDPDGVGDETTQDPPSSPFIPTTEPINQSGSPELIQGGNPF